MPYDDLRGEAVTSTSRERAEEELITVGEYRTAMEAEWARAVLASAGLCAMLPDQAMGTILDASGPLRLQVPESKAEEARAILSEMELERGLYLEARERGEVEEADDGAPQEPLEDGSAVDPRDLCPSSPGLTCPACSSEEVGPSFPPKYAVESAAGAFLKRLFGKGWFRCSSCGHTWER
jgi:hypothetical protein